MDRAGAPTSLRRRRALQAGVPASLIAAFPVIARGAAGRLKSNPFTLGVASGEPDAHSVVIWTRLLLDEGDGWEPIVHPPVPVRWQVFEDPAASRLVAGGEVDAVAEDAHSVHVSVDGLKPGTRYWYRFEAGSHRSPLGATKTLPSQASLPGSVRFAVVSCQNFEDGFFSAYREIASSELDFVVHLGDYIYERGALGPNPVRRHGMSVPTTLGEYRARYARYRSDPMLRAAHAAAPWFVIWDDHEVEDDYAGDQSQDLHPVAFFRERRAAAYRAYYEHMPLRPTNRPQDAQLALYRSAMVGALAGMHFLDCRQYRHSQACNPPHSGGARWVTPCAAMADPARSMLGTEQERWLARRLAATGTRWQLVMQSTLLSPAPSVSGRVSNDTWDGYPAARDRLIKALAASPADGRAVFGGDIHAFVAASLRDRSAPGRGHWVGAEFNAGSLSSANPRHRTQEDRLLLNPDIRFADGGHRGYLSCKLSRDALEVTFRATSDPKRADATMQSLARFTATPGRDELIG
ncbi:MAG: alkaline phosphatase D family protein [Burkholderiaceae bacterium]|nr:alkaline phosphatase D family protein [Burkholderiaceae bacterium]